MQPGFSVLIANRGEIAVRVIRTVAELGGRSIAIYSEDDHASLHVLKADKAIQLSKQGPAGYLDIAEILTIAQDNQCDAIHPGYGFLSESKAFAQACGKAGIIFIGPVAETLDTFGDKAKARALAEACGVPVLQGTSNAVSESEAAAFFTQLPKGAGMAIKAIAGGGGRGLRVVNEASAISPAFARCRSEALAAFGRGDLYVEQWAPKARHIEVQIIGDGVDCVHLFERECTLQRRHQKVIEVAPSPSIDQRLREQLCQSAIRMAKATQYQGLGTFEFLVFDQDNEQAYVFLEANPRIQVEHTVTESVLGLDLVELQLNIAFGKPLSGLGLDNLHLPQGYAAQARINLETMQPNGDIKTACGTIAGWDVPTGNGVRIDTYVYGGYQTSPRYDAMVAKLIVHSPRTDYQGVLKKLQLALKEFRISGVAANLGLLSAISQHKSVLANTIHTGFLDEHLGELLLSADGQSHSFLPDSPQPLGAVAEQFDLNENDIAAPMQGSVVQVFVESDADVAQGDALIVMESMKMEHVIEAPAKGKVKQVYAAPGQAIQEGQPLLNFAADEVDTAAPAVADNLDLNVIRDDLQQVYDHHAYGYDENRPEAVAKRHKTGQRTARENILDLCDEGSFVEYGPLVIAAQRRRRSVQDLMENTPGDGMVTGLGRVNGDLFTEENAQCVVMTYDYTVMAGTQGIQNHHKKDRMFELAERLKTPVVLFSEGGGGRPGDTDGLGSSAGLDCLAFLYFARLSGQVPLVGIAAGRNFAGNAALLGCCDVVIATQNANIGMGGPAMIEGGGLGIYKPEEVGPASVQSKNGVIDVLVNDEAEGVAVAKQYLSYFQGALSQWACADQRLLRQLVPENRLRIYDVRKVIDTLFDTGSVLELRREFGKGMVTCLARIEGRPVGVIANNPKHLAGAIDADGADKSARFMQLCNAFAIPVVFLCDTPGIMVGPDVEKTALVRHASRLFVTAASLSIPFCTVVLRKAYGLGAMTMAGGSLKAPIFTVAWPTGEFGAMGLEGAVKLGFKKELAAAESPQAQQALFDKMVAEMYERGKAVNNATFFEFDDVIDPAETRHWIMAGLLAAKQSDKNSDGKTRGFVDTW